MRAIVFSVVVLLSCSLGSVSLADGKSHRKAVQELMSVMQMKKVMKSSIDSMLEMQVEANPQMAPFRDAMKDFFQKYMGWDAIKEDFEKLYMETFTEKEIKELLAFYKTDTGKKAATAVPKLMAKGAKIGQERVQAHMGELIQTLQRQQQKSQ